MPRIDLRGVMVDVDAIVFDKDGTLVDLRTYWSGRAVRAIAALASSLPGIGGLDERLRTSLGVDPHEPVLRADGPFAAAPFSDICAAAAVVLYQNGERWDAAIEQVRRVFLPVASAPPAPGEIKPLADLSGLFKGLRNGGLAIAVATTDDRRPTELFLEEIGCLRLIDHLACGDDPPPRKPDPALLRDLAVGLGTDIERLLVVSDTRSDLVMAAAAGAVFAGVLSGAGSAADFAGAHAILTTVADLRIGSVRRPEGQR